MFVSEQEANVIQKDKVERVSGSTNSLAYIRKRKFSKKKHVHSSVTQCNAQPIYERKK